MNLLHLDSSILGPHSISRILSADVVARQRALHPGLEVVYRDLAAEPTPHLTGAHMAAWQGAPVEDQAFAADLAKGAAFIDELFAADIIVIGAPMYNFAIPTQLKAWIDRVAVAADQAWIRRFAALGHLFTKAELKVFALEDLAEARAWIAAD